MAPESFSAVIRSAPAFARLGLSTRDACSVLAGTVTSVMIRRAIHERTLVVAFGAAVRSRTGYAIIALLAVRSLARAAARSASL
jgi:hypothetical protein